MLNSCLWRYLLVFLWIVYGFISSKITYLRFLLLLNWFINIIFFRTWNINRIILVYWTFLTNWAIVKFHHYLIHQDLRTLRLFKNQLSQNLFKKIIILKVTITTLNKVVENVLVDVLFLRIIHSLKIFLSNAFNYYHTEWKQMILLS